MAKVYLTEYIGSVGQSNAPRGNPLARQTINITGASLGSNPFNKDTHFIRVHTDAICSIAIDAAATANTERMAAGQTEYLGVNPGSTLNVITNT